jgi:hypothetical protein
MTASATNHADKLIQSGNVSSKSQLIKGASILGTNDAFLFIGIIAVIGFVVAIIMPNKYEVSTEEKTRMKMQHDIKPAEGK